MSSMARVSYCVDIISTDASVFGCWLTGVRISLADWGRRQCPTGEWVDDGKTRWSDEFLWAMGDGRLATPASPALWCGDPRPRTKVGRDPKLELAENVETLGRGPSGRNLPGSANAIGNNLHWNRDSQPLSMELYVGDGALCWQSSFVLAMGQWAQLGGLGVHGVLNPTPPTVLLLP
jgi:hypothetical protein